MPQQGWISVQGGSLWKTLKIWKNNRDTKNYIEYNLYVFQIFNKESTNLSWINHFANQKNEKPELTNISFYSINWRVSFFSIRTTQKRIWLNFRLSLGNKKYSMYSYIYSMYVYNNVYLVREWRILNILFTFFFKFNVHFELLFFFFNINIYNKKY